ncbi:UNVERIFIED_CONTAM: hypothetical protein FKN15_015211 [Acipenser sinensis]
MYGNWVCNGAWTAAWAAGACLAKSSRTWAIWDLRFIMSLAYLKRFTLLICGDGERLRGHRTRLCGPLQPLFLHPGLKSRTVAAGHLPLEGQGGVLDTQAPRTEADEVYSTAGMRQGLAPWRRARLEESLNSGDAARPSPVEESTAGRVTQQRGCGKA